MGVCQQVGFCYVFVALIGHFCVFLLANYVILVEYDVLLQDHISIRKD